MIKISNNSSVLIFTLWIVLLLTLFALGLSYRAKVELKSVSFDIDELKAHYLCKSAAKWLIKDLKSGYKGYDIESDLIDYNISDYKLGEGTFKIENVVDEESKINLNKIPLEVLGEILNRVSSSISPNSVQNINNYRPFENLESLMLIEGIDEEILKDLSNTWLTVYGNGKINFYTTTNDIINVLKVLPGVKISKLKENVCEGLNSRFDCCGHSDVETISISAKDSIFNAIKNVKKNNNFFKKIKQLKNGILNTDIVKQNRINVKNTLQMNLYNCCMDNYDAIDKGTYCRSWAQNESFSITEKIFEDYILGEIFDYIDIKSNNYRADIISEVHGLKKHVTVVVNRFSEDINYWYSHYYNEYEK